MRATISSHRCEGLVEREVENQFQVKYGMVKYMQVYILQSVYRRHSSVNETEGTNIARAAAAAAASYRASPKCYEGMLNVLISH